MNLGGCRCTRTTPQLLCLALACALLAGCAGVQRRVWAPAPDVQAAPLLARDWLAAPGVDMLRLQGRLLFGARKVGLTAMMRRDAGRRTARIVLMGDMGLTLCDMDVTPSGQIVHSAVPDLKKATRVLRHVARTVRRIFLLPGPGEAGEPEVRRFDAELMLPQRGPQLEGGPEVERVYDADTGLLVRLASPEAGWEVSFSEYEKMTQDGLPFPGRIEYRDTSGGYTVQLQLLSLQPAKSA